MELDDDPEAKIHFSEAIEVGMQWHLVPYVLRALVGISDLLIRQQNWEQAVLLLGLVLAHPAVAHQPKQAASLLLKQVEARLAPDALAAGVEAAKTLRLDAVVQTLLTQQLAPTPASPHGAGHTAKFLSQRELEILRLLADGLTNREIAERLFLATSTVKWYTLEIYSKLHVANRTQAVSRARALSLLA
jgi:ATP/maltotriose-dependent transcriptional regulator MalT